MRRTLTFEAHDITNPAPARRFALLYTGFVVGGNALHVDARTGAPTARSRDERAKEATVLRALKAISHEVNDDGEAVDDGDGAGKRKLAGEGGIVDIGQKDFELLTKYLEAAPFPTGDSDRVDDLLDWVSAAEKHDG